jgi:hypothetical protein
MKKRPQPILRFELQRAAGDCAIACLATISGKSYEDILVAAAKEKKVGCAPHETGLYMTAVVSIAKRIGYPLKKKRKCDFQKDKGILSVEFGNGLRLPHVIVLLAGLLFETDGSVWLPWEYKKAHRAKFGSILIPDV